MTIDEECAPDREILGWNEFGEASRELATQVRQSGFVPDMVVAIAHGGLLLAGSAAYVLEPDFVWRSTSQWITFPWSSLPPVAA